MVSLVPLIFWKMAHSHVGKAGLVEGGGREHQMLSDDSFFF